MVNRRRLLGLSLALVAVTCLPPRVAFSQRPRPVKDRQARINQATKLLTQALQANQQALERLQKLEDRGEIPAILQLLHRAYSLQADSTTPIDGLVREQGWAGIPEPNLEKYSYMTAYQAKPATNRAMSSLGAGAVQEAIGHLQAAINVQTRQLSLLF